MEFCRTIQREFDGDHTIGATLQDSLRIPINPVRHQTIGRQQDNGRLVLPVEETGYFDQVIPQKDLAA